VLHVYFKIENSHRDLFIFSQSCALIFILYTLAVLGRTGWGKNFRIYAIFEVVAQIVHLKLTEVETLRSPTFSDVINLR